MRKTSTGASAWVGVGLVYKLKVTYPAMLTQVFLRDKLRNEVVLHRTNVIDIVYRLNKLNWQRLTISAEGPMVVGAVEPCSGDCVSLNVL